MTQAPQGTQFPRNAESQAHSQEAPRAELGHEVPLLPSNLPCFLVQGLGDTVPPGGGVCSCGGGGTHTGGPSASGNPSLHDAETGKTVFSLVWG